MSDFNLEIIIGIASVLIAVIAVIVAVKVKKSTNKGNHKKISTDFLSNLENILGGKGNIKEVSNEGGRIKFVLDDMSLVDLESLKKLAKSGVLVTGNSIKILFEYSIDHVITYFN